MLKMTRSLRLIRLRAWLKFAGIILAQSRIYFGNEGSWLKVSDGTVHKLDSLKT